MQKMKLNEVQFSQNRAIKDTQDQLDNLLNLATKGFITADEYKDKIVKEGYDVQYGARPLRRAIQTHVEDVVCQKILNESEVHEIAL